MLVEEDILVILVVDMLEVLAVALNKLVVVLDL